MDPLEEIQVVDEEAVLWLNGWVGEFPWLDAVVRLIVSDYLVPLTFALVLLGLWFASRSPATRESNQYGVMAGVLGIVLSNLAVEIMNDFFFRPRPFAELQVSLLFYRPTDSSFPANPAALGFSVATAVWMWNRKVGYVLYVLAAAYSLSRVYAGVFYLSDILGGAIIGVAAGVLATLLLRAFKSVPQFVLRVARTLYLG